MKNMNEKGLQKVLSEGSYYHFKYTQIIEIEKFIETKVREDLFSLADSPGVKPWARVPHHRAILVVNNIDHYFKNETYKVLVDTEGSRPDIKTEHQLRNHGYYVQLDSKILPSRYLRNQYIVTEMKADEYKKEIQTKEEVSDFFEITSNRFSIVIPKDENNTTATLSFIHHGEVNFYNPYTFTEDSILRKENTLQLPSDMIEVLFFIK